MEASEVLLYQASALPVGTSIEENSQPFRQGRWLFAHLGQVREFEKVRPRLFSSLPEFLQRQVRGDTGSELAFAVFLKFLRETRHNEDRAVNAPLAAQLLGRTVQTLEQFTAEAGATKTSTLNFLATDGRVLCASRFGDVPLYYTLLEGTAHCERCKLDPTAPDEQPAIRAHRRHRSVVLASKVADTSTWLEIPNGTVLAVDSRLNIQRMPI
jgi:glutamine amidotransferase